MLLISLCWHCTKFSFCETFTVTNSMTKISLIQTLPNFRTIKCWFILHLQMYRNMPSVSTNYIADILHFNNKHICTHTHTHTHTHIFIYLAYMYMYILLLWDIYIYICIYMFIICIYICIYVYISISICLSIYLSIYISIYISVYIYR